MNIRPRPPVAVVVAAAVGIAAGVGIATFADADPVRHAAVARAALFPVTTAADEPDSSLFQTLARGELVASYAEVVRRRSATEVATPDDVSVSVQEETAVIRLEVRQATTKEAVAGVREVLSDSVTFLNGLGQPYRLTVIEPGTPLPGPASGGDGPRTAAAAIVGASVAILAYRAIRSVRRRDEASHIAPTANSTE